MLNEIIQAKAKCKSEIPEMVNIWTNGKDMFLYFKIPLKVNCIKQK